MHSQAIVENSSEPLRLVVLSHATPDDSDTGDWQIPSGRPSATVTDTSPDGEDNLNISVGTTENRPGKSSRDLHDLQENVHHLSQETPGTASITQVESALMEEVKRDEFHTLSGIVSRGADLAQVEAMRAEPIRDSDRGDFQGFADGGSRTLDLDQDGLVGVHHEFQASAATSRQESTAFQDEVAETEATKEAYHGQMPTLTKEMSCDTNLAVVGIEQDQATRAKFTTIGLFKWIGPLLSIASLCFAGHALSTVHQQNLIIAQLLLQQEELTNQVKSILNHDDGQGTSQAGVGESETRSTGDHFKKLKELEASIRYLYDQKAHQEVHARQLKEHSNHITYLYSSKADKEAYTEQLKEHSNHITYLYSSKANKGAHAKELKEHSDLITYLSSSKADKGANAKELKEHSDRITHLYSSKAGKGANARELKEHSDHITHLYSSKADKGANAKELKEHSDRITHLYSSMVDKSVLYKLFKEHAWPSSGANSEATNFFAENHPSYTSGKASAIDHVHRAIDHIHRAFLHGWGH